MMFRSNFDYGEGFYSDLSKCKDDLERSKLRQKILANILDNNDEHSIDFQQEITDASSHKQNRDLVNSNTQIGLLPIDAKSPDDEWDVGNDLLPRSNQLGLLTDSFNRKEDEDIYTTYKPKEK